MTLIGSSTLGWRKALVVAGMTVMAVACASGGGKVAQRLNCPLPDRDSVFALSGPVFRDCGVDRIARRLPSNVHPDFRPAAPRSACYSADIEFVVDTMGTPETRTARVVRTNEQGFAKAVLETLMLWKYDPAVRDQQRVRQIVAAHETMATMVAVVPAGSSPPAGPPRQRPPSC